VKVLGMRPAEGPGRPVQIFGLAETALGEHLSGLAGALLEQIRENVTEEKRDVYLQALAVRLKGEHSSSSPNGGVNITRRLAVSIEQLNRLGYEARWEAHAAAPRIIFENCPYSQLVSGHPELCRMDAFLLQEYLGRDVEQIAKLEKNARGTLFCQFVL